MTTKSNDQKGKIPLAASALGGLTAGWFLNRYRKKKLALEEHQPIVQRLKNAEQKLYEDGRIRAYDLETIKQETRTKA